MSFYCRFCRSETLAGDSKFNCSEPDARIWCGVCDTVHPSRCWQCECHSSWCDCAVHQNSPEWMRWRRNKDVNTFRRKPKPIVENICIVSSKKVLATNATNSNSVRKNRFLKTVNVFNIMIWGFGDMSDPYHFQPFKSSLSKSNSAADFQ